MTKSTLLILLFSFNFVTTFAFTNDSTFVSKKIIRKLNLKHHKINLVYFLEKSCPISQKYQSIIREIDKNIESDNTNSIFIFPNKFSPKSESINFAKEINDKSKIIIDKKLFYTKIIGATITPEVFLISEKGEIIYSGAIDNWFYSLGKSQKEATEFYLKNAISNYLLDKHISPIRTIAIGCDIEI